MPKRLRFFWLPLAVIAYVCFAAAEASGGFLPWVALGLIPFGLAELWRRVLRGDEPSGSIEEKAKQAVLATLFGIALWLAARTGPAGRPVFDAMANVATGIAATAGLVALARIRGQGGLLVPKPATASLDAAAFTAMLWAVAVALPGSRAVAPELFRVDPLAIDYATTTAALGTLLVYLATTWRLRILRRYELGVGDRALGAWALALSVFGVAIPAAFLDVGPPDRVLPVAVLVGAACAAWTATTSEPTHVATVLRGTLAVMLPGVPLLLAAGVLTRQYPEHGSTILLATLPLATTIGLIARAVAKPLGPQQSRWLEAIDAASRGALEPEPDAAIRAALLALNQATHVVGNRPELWRADPPQVLSVDRAGYLNTETSSAPERLHELALAEPERTLRREALDAAQIRFPEVRPILAWFDARRAFSATLIVDVDGALGFLLLPQGNRTAPMTLEEARAVRILADRMSALLAISSALARSRERELAAHKAAKESQENAERLAQIVARSAERNALVARSAQGELTRSTYSSEAKRALHDLISLGRKNVNLFAQAAAGLDAAAWLAVAHLASPRKGGAWVAIDGASGEAHKSEYWNNSELSPLALVDGGTLVITNAPSLPGPIQEQLAQWITQQAARQGSEIPHARVYLTAPISLQEAVETGALIKTLARAFDEGFVELPSLAERPEDLRSIILGHLARFGMGLHREPLGLDEAALRALIEHSWPANDLELTAVLLRATLACQSTTLCLRDLRDSGFNPHAGLERAEADEPKGPIPSEPPRVRRRVARTR